MFSLHEHVFFLYAERNVDLELCVRPSSVLSFSFSLLSFYIAPVSSERNRPDVF